jgi:hypothetical protein
MYRMDHLISGGVLLVVLVLKSWEGVDEGNKRDSIWELMKEIRWSCPVHDYACCYEIFRLYIKPNVISRYHPKTKSGVGTQLGHISLRRYPSYESYMETLIYAQVSIK